MVPSHSAPGPRSYSGADDCPRQVYLVPTAQLIQKSAHVTSTGNPSLAGPLSQSGFVAFSEYAPHAYLCYNTPHTLLMIRTVSMQSLLQIPTNFC
jgi:hypothetical protein